MSVIKTDQWLIEFYKRPHILFKLLKPYFDNASPLEIFEYLMHHGMSRVFNRATVHTVQGLQKNNVWEMVENDEKFLRKLWNGPNIPIFIFPAEPNNLKIHRDFNGKSGVAFKDKLFLFITEQHREKEIRALLTHEYNHVCRLAKYQKNDKHYVLLDAIILEGLAENAVRERFGSDYLAAWTAYYSDEELEKMWTSFIYPHRNIAKTNRKYEELLYGFGLRYPKMLGYCVGYYLVEKYMNKKGVNLKDLLVQKTEVIAEIKDLP